MRLGRPIWAALGLLCVGSGFVGTVVPGWPTTVFLILALFCFKKGSSKFERWLLEHPVFGPSLRDWEKYKGIRKKHKQVAIVTMWVFITGSAVFLVYRGKPVVSGIVVAFGLIGTWYILSRPTIPVDAENPTVAETLSTNDDQAFG